MPPCRASAGLPTAKALVGDAADPKHARPLSSARPCKRSRWDGTNARPRGFCEESARQCLDPHCKALLRWRCACLGDAGRVRTILACSLSSSGCPSEGLRLSAAALQFVLLAGLWEGCSEPPRSLQTAPEALSRRWQRMVQRQPRRRARARALRRAATQRPAQLRSAAVPAGAHRRAASGWRVAAQVLSPKARCPTLRSPRKWSSDLALRAPRSLQPPEGGTPSASRPGRTRRAAFRSSDTQKTYRRRQLWLPAVRDSCQERHR
mmetsp:Transcript_14528/g.23110  ORF Transcript_14528/g.23110 Transcript_14528/m.23110 type:complete len:264 (-) Transcript_14528:228-1019(-)